MIMKKEKEREKKVEKEKEKEEENNGGQCKQNCAAIDPNAKDGY